VLDGKERVRLESASNEKQPDSFNSLQFLSGRGENFGKLMICSRNLNSSHLFSRVAIPSTPPVFERQLVYRSQIP
jgi:hypothetical protein